MNKYEYNDLLSAKVSEAFLYTKQKYFELGDKPYKRVRVRQDNLGNKNNDAGEASTDLRDIINMSNSIKFIHDTKYGL